MMKDLYLRKAVRYIKRTLKNKLCAIILLTCGALTITVTNDATGLVFVSIIAIPLFFAKENWMY